VTRPHQVYFKTGQEMRGIYVQRQKADHAAANKALVPGLRPRFDEAAAVSRSEAVPLGGEYAYGWSYSPSTSIAAFGAYHPVDLNDACTMWGDMGGTMFVTVASCAGHHTVSQAYSIFYDNECEYTWDLHNDFIDNVYGSRWNSKHRRRLSDLDKGLWNSMKKHLTNGGIPFACLYHRVPNVAKAVGTVGKQQYIAAANATSTSRVSVTLSHTRPLILYRCTHAVKIYCPTSLAQSLTPSALSFSFSFSLSLSVYSPNSLTQSLTPSALAFSLSFFLSLSLFLSLAGC
jgi:hypothetical protein